MKNNLGIYIKMVWVHFFYLVVLLLFAGGYAFLGLLDNVSSDIKLLHFNNILMGATLTFLVLYLFSKFNKKSVGCLGWHFNIKDCYFLIVTCIVSLLIVSIFIFVLKQNQILTVNLQLNKFKDFNYYALLFWALIGWMMASLKEEVISRGYVLFNLTHLNIWMMVLISAVVFMSLHLPTTKGFDLLKMASWFLGGLAYVYVYIKSGSLVVSTFVHMIHNYVNDWFLGNNSQFAIVILSQKVSQGEKLIYELILKVIIITLTFAFYGRNGLTTPAPNLLEAWSKNDKSKVKKA